MKKELPGPIVKTTEELITAVQNIKDVEVAYFTRYEQFAKRFISLEDGHATERVVHRFFKL